MVKKTAVLVKRGLSCEKKDLYADAVREEGCSRSPVSAKRKSELSTLLTVAEDVLESD